MNPKEAASPLLKEGQLEISAHSSISSFSNRDHPQLMVLQSHNSCSEESSSTSSRESAAKPTLSVILDQQPILRKSSTMRNPRPKESCTDYREELVEDPDQLQVKSGRKNQKQLQKFESFADPVDSTVDRPGDDLFKIKKRSSKGSACSRYDGASEGSRLESGVDFKPLNLKVDPVIQKIVDDISDKKEIASVSQRLTILGAKSSNNGKSPTEMMTSSPNFSKNLEIDSRKCPAVGLSAYLGPDDMHQNSVSVSSQSNNVTDARSMQILKVQKNLLTVTDLKSKQFPNGGYSILRSPTMSRGDIKPQKEIEKDSFKSDSLEEAVASGEGNMASANPMGVSQAESKKFNQELLSIEKKVVRQHNSQRNVFKDGLEDHPSRKCSSKSHAVHKVPDDNRDQYSSSDISKSASERPQSKAESSQAPSSRRPPRKFLGYQEVSQDMTSIDLSEEEERMARNPFLANQVAQASMFKGYKSKVITDSFSSSDSKEQTPEDSEEINSDELEDMASKFQISKALILTQIERKQTNVNEQQLRKLNDSPRLNDVDDEEDIMWHVKLFGYIPNYESKQYMAYRIKKLQSLSRKSNMGQFQDEITELQSKIQVRQQNNRTIDPNVPQQRRRFTTKITPRKKKSQLMSSMSMISEYEFKPAEQFGDELEKKRRQHFYRGMEKEDFHNFFDRIYHKFRKKEQERALKKMHMNVQLPLASSQKQRNWTIRQDSIFFPFWKVLKLLASLFSTISYAYFTVNGFPEFRSFLFWALINMEVIFFFDMGVNFLLQKIDEQGRSQNLPLQQVASQYLHSGFIIDFLAFIPFGLILSELAGPEFRLLWVIKMIRLKDLYFYTSMAFFQPMIEFYISKKQRQNLANEEKREEVNEDLIYIDQKIHLKNFFKVFRLILQTLFIVYFAGQIWFIIVQAAINTDGDENHFIDRFSHSLNFLNTPQWDLVNTEGYHRTVVAMYFALTSLSTTGFGDYYPVTNFERLVCSFILLSGVSLFSYILSEFRYMIRHFKHLNSGLEQMEKLDEFFVLLMKFNDGQPLNIDLQNRIREFMSLKWNQNKNNFLLTYEDQMLLDQLPTSVQTSIYTDFLYSDFLQIFRRFFQFQKIVQQDILFFQKQNSQHQITFQKAQLLYSQDPEVQRKLKKQPLSNYKYPFYTIENEAYCQFMKLIMNYLEVRQYKPGEHIAQEMDESLEVLFVEKGRYEVGYEINKREFYRLHFGRSTIIGGFQICYMKRFLFAYKAKSTVEGQAIRKQNFVAILDRFPQFRYQVQKKFYIHFSQQVYMPLIKRKNTDIMDYNFRSDYKQVLYLQEKDESFFLDCFQKNHEDMRIFQSHDDQKQIDINNQLRLFNFKLNIIESFSIGVFRRTEKLLETFFDRLGACLLKRWLAGRDYSQIQQAMRHYHHRIFPLKLRLTAALYDVRVYEEVEFEFQLQSLKLAAFGLNPFKRIKKELDFKNLKGKKARPSCRPSLLLVGQSMNIYQDLIQSSLSNLIEEDDSQLEQTSSFSSSISKVSERSNEETSLEQSFDKRFSQASGKHSTRNLQTFTLKPVRSKESSQSPRIANVAARLDSQPDESKKEAGGAESLSVKSRHRADKIREILTMNSPTGFKNTLRVNPTRQLKPTFSFQDAPEGKRGSLTESQTNGRGQESSGSDQAIQPVFKQESLINQIQSSMPSSQMVDSTVKLAANSDGKVSFGAIAAVSPNDTPKKYLHTRLQTIKESQSISDNSPASRGKKGVFSENVSNSGTMSPKQRVSDHEKLSSGLVKQQTIQSKTDQTRKLSSHRLKPVQVSSQLRSEVSKSGSSTSSFNNSNSRPQFKLIDVGKLSSKGCMSGAEERKGSSSSRSNRKAPTLGLDNLEQKKRERNLSVSLQKSEKNQNLAKPSQFDIQLGRTRTSDPFGGKGIVTIPSTSLLSHSSSSEMNGSENLETPQLNTAYEEEKDEIEFNKRATSEFAPVVAVPTLPLLGMSSEKSPPPRGLGLIPKSNSSSSSSPVSRREAPQPVALEDTNRSNERGGNRSSNHHRANRVSAHNTALFSQQQHLQVEETKEERKEESNSPQSPNFNESFESNREEQKSSHPTTHQTNDLGTALSDQRSRGAAQLRANIEESKEGSQRDTILPTSSEDGGRLQNLTQLIRQLDETTGALEHESPPRRLTHPTRRPQEFEDSVARGEIGRDFMLSMETHEESKRPEEYSPQEVNGTALLRQLQTVQQRLQNYISATSPQNHNNIDVFRLENTPDKREGREISPSSNISDELFTSMLQVRPQTEQQTTDPPRRVMPAPERFIPQTSSPATRVQVMMQTPSSPGPEGERGAEFQKKLERVFNFIESINKLPGADSSDGPSKQSKHSRYSKYSKQSKSTGGLPSTKIKKKKKKAIYLKKGELSYLP